MSEEYQIKDLSSLHKYRTEIPNIVHDLDLDVFAFRLYTLIKKIAGDGGKCFCSNAYLMEKCKMGKDKLIECKKILSSPFALLNNKPLIKIQKRRSEEKGDQPDLITIEDIWLINILHIEEIKKQNIVSAESTGGVGNTDGGSRPNRHKEEPLAKKNQNLTTTTRASAPDVDEILFSKEERERLKNFTEEQIAEAKRKTNNECVQTKNESRVKFFFKVLESNAKKKPKLSVYEELCQYFKHGECYSFAECTLNPDAIAFRRGMKYGDLFLKYFSWDKFKDLCDSFGIEFARA